MLTIYKASAGSGKTFTLAYQYIKLLLGVRLESGAYVLNTRKYAGQRTTVRPHSHILAITFTNKATAEMKTRIIRELDRLRAMPADGAADTPYAAMLVADFGCTREELAEAAGRALRRILNDYNNFNVSTIDSFFQSLLRSFAREIDRQGDYRLELDKDTAIVTAVSMLLDDVNERAVGLDPFVVKWLRARSAENMTDGKDFNPFNRSGSIFRTLVRSVTCTFDEAFARHSREVHDFLKRPGAIDRFTAALGRLNSETDDRIQKMAEALEKQLAAEGYGTDVLNRSIEKRLAESLGRCHDKTFAADLVSTAGQPKYIAALQAHDESLLSRGGFFKAKTRASAAMYGALYDWFDAVSAGLPRKAVHEVMLKSVDTLRALSFINDYVNRFRQDNNLILIGDTNSLVKAIIDGSETPFIYEKVGVQLDHFLIDEFQDTSAMQWNNLKPLVGNSLASDHDSLIIGDVKQSIYRWRGGDSSLLDNRVEKEDFPERSIVRGAAPGENTNYRSAHGIVRFNNSLFKTIADALAIPGYGGVAQSLPAGTAGMDARICIRTLDSAMLNAAEPDDADGAPAGPAQELSAAELDVCRGADGSLVPKLVAIMLTGHTIIDEHERGYRWKDIAVLCRQNVDTALVAELFGLYFPQIQLLSDEALIVGRAPSVRLIISILQLIDMAGRGDSIGSAEDDRVTPGVEDQQDPVATPVTDGSLSRIEMLTDRFEYFLCHGEDFDRALTMALDPEVNTTADGERYGSLKLDLQAIRADAPANLVALVESIIARKIPAGQRAAELPYINAFLDTVNNFSANYIPTVHAFLEYWESVAESLAISGSDGVDAVSVMTVHKAKGLEWDCVHIPILDWELDARTTGAWFSLEEFTDIPSEDRPPLLYMYPVAAFRAACSPFKAAVDEAVEMDTTDNLNVVYVAFTRAVRELHVYMPDEGHSSGESGKTAAEAIRRALTANVADPGTLYLDLAAYSSGPGEWCYGLPTSPVSPAEKSVPDTKHGPAEATPTAPGPFRVAFTALNRQMTRVEDLVSDPTSDPDVDMPPLGDRTPGDEPDRRTAAMHAILSRMETRDDLDMAIAGVIANTDIETADYCRETIVRAMDSGGEEVARWFAPVAPRRLLEQTVYDARRDENYRVNRLVWREDDTVDVVDYRFTPGHEDSHFSRVRTYMRLLGAMGYSKVRGYIWYVMRGEIVEVIP